jgi:excisionase family DNA binding protein
MSARLTPVFVRLPRSQAAALDRLAAESGRAKQHVVSELVAQALTAPGPAPLTVGRVELSTAPASRHNAALSVPRDDEILTLDDVASLLRLPADAVQARAEAGDLPGRRFGKEWRFSRLAVLAWLAEGEAPPGRRKR